MNILQAIFLGFVQGLTEFIPVSSSGHLVLIQQLFSWNGSHFHLFLEFINLGTLLALLIYFRKRIWSILIDIFKHHNFHLAANLLITSIPAGLIGLALSDFIDSAPFFSSLFTIACAMGIVGLIMIIIDRLPHLSPLKNENELSPFRALAIGLLQVFALIPGTSRSGTTIIAGRLMGLDSESSANYSFLASIPIMTGVCLKMFLSSSSRAYLAANLPALLIGNLVAFVVGWFALKFLLAYLKKPGSLQTFGKYRLVLALVIIGGLLIIA